MIDIADISDLLSAAQILLTAVLGALVLYLRRWFVTRAEFREHAEKQATANEDARKRLTSQSERLTAAEARVQRSEDRIAELPGGDAIAELRLSIERLAGDVRVVTTELKGMAELHRTLKRQVDVMDEFLRKIK